MKPAILRPLARRDREMEVRHYRKEAGSKIAVQMVKTTSAALDRIELDPGIGSPVLGKALGIPGLRTWKVSEFPLLWIYFVRDDHLDVVRLLGERQDVATILASALGGDERHLRRWTLIPQAKLAKFEEAKNKAEIKAESKAMKK